MRLAAGYGLGSWGLSPGKVLLWEDGSRAQPSSVEGLGLGTGWLAGPRAEDGTSPSLVTGFQWEGLGKTVHLHGWVTMRKLRPGSGLINGHPDRCPSMRKGLGLGPGSCQACLRGISFLPSQLVSSKSVLPCLESSSGTGHHSLHGSQGHWAWRLQGAQNLVLLIGKVQSQPSVRPLM